MSKRTFTDYEIDNWNWNFSITTQNQHDHALGLLGSISEAVEKINHSETRIALLTALIETSKRLIEREENSI
jgi:hypothetical protein